MDSKHNEHDKALISLNAPSHMMSRKWSEENIIKGKARRCKKHIKIYCYLRRVEISAMQKGHENISIVIETWENICWSRFIFGDRFEVQTLIEFASNSAEFLWALIESQFLFVTHTRLVSHVLLLVVSANWNKKSWIFISNSNLLPLFQFGVRYTRRMRTKDSWIMLKHTLIQVTSRCRRCFSVSYLPSYFATLWNVSPPKR
jgi:hypothetical protein